MRKLIYQVMFDKLQKIGLIDKRGYPVFGEHTKIVNKPYMDLSVDNLGSDVEKGYPIFKISLAHNFIQNGDLMADPDMEIRIYPYAGFIEALSYQLDSMGIYQVVYPEPGKVYPKRKKELNRFLNQWLTNLIDQGFKFNPSLTPLGPTDEKEVLRIAQEYGKECEKNRIAMVI